MAYTVEIWREGESGIDRTLLSTDDIKEARRAYEAADAEYPDRIVMLRNKALVLRRSKPNPDDNRQK